MIVNIYRKIFFTGTKVFFLKAANPPIEKRNIVSLEIFLNIRKSLYSFASKSPELKLSKTEYIRSDSSCTKPFIEQLITNFTEEVIVLKANPSKCDLIIGKSFEREIVQILNVIKTIVSVMSIMRTQVIE